MNSGMRKITLNIIHLINGLGGLIMIMTIFKLELLFLVCSISVSTNNAD